MAEWRTATTDKGSVELKCRNPYEIGTTMLCPYQRLGPTHKSAHNR